MLLQQSVHSPPPAMAHTRMHLLDKVQTYQRDIVDANPRAVQPFSPGGYVQALQASMGIMDFKVLALPEIRKRRYVDGKDSIVVSKIGWHFQKRSRCQKTHFEYVCCSDVQ